MAKMILTDQLLRDAVFALHTSLDRVCVDELDSPLARSQWQWVRQWLTEAEAFSDTAAGGDGFVRLRAFPVSGTDLRALQLAVDQAEARRAAQQASRAASTTRQRHIPEAPHQSIGRVSVTSTILAAALILSLLINVGWLVLFHLGLLLVPHLALILATNSAVTVITLGAWVLHLRRLRAHARSVRWHGPSITYPAEPLQQPIP